jgi:hypothetical protein
LHAQPAAPRQLRSRDGDVNETGASARQFDLLAAERQLTLDGREEPLVAAPAAVPGGPREGKDTATVELPFNGKLPEQLEVLLPKSCRACLHGAWHFSLIDKKTGEAIRVPFACGSWRCLKCGRHVAATDFARIKEGLGSVPAEELVFLVLTLDQKAEKARGITATTAYAASQRKWQTLTQSLRRRYGKCRFLRTVEQHQSHWPHLNVVVHSPGLALALKDRHINCERYVTGDLRDLIVSAGFGGVATAERPRDVAAISGYITKTAHLNTLTGEVVKLSQLPVFAPFRTRRLSSSPGLLPPRRGSSGQWIGELVKQSLEEARQLEMRAAQAQRESLRTWTLRVMSFSSRAVPAPASPEGVAEGQAQPSRSRGRVGACLVTTRLSHTATQLAEPYPLPPEALAGADPPGGRSSALSFIVSSGPNAGAA